MAFDGKDWQLRIIYNTTPTGFSVMEHVERHWLNVVDADPVGAAFAAILVQPNAGVNLPLSDYVDDYMAGLSARHSTVTEFSRAELWTAEPDSSNFTFHAVYALGTTGAFVGTAQVAQQETYTFRSNDGKTARVQIMEGCTTGNGRNAYPYTGTALTLADFVTGSGGAFITRSGGKLIASINLLLGQNEQLFEKRFRS